MSLISKASKLLVPIRQCISFEKDKCFESVRTTLEDTGIKWTDFIQSKSAKIGGHEFMIPKMDSIFFHDDRFEILIDARGFQPENVKCKITPNAVEVLAQRQEKSNASSRSLSLARNYHLPRNVKPEEGNCCLSSEGILLVTAPWAA